MADAAMVVEVVTPEQSLIAGPASAIMLRSSDGELTVLPGHTPLVTDVVSGVVRVDQEEGGEARLAVHGGFLHVDTGPGAAASAEPAAVTGVPPTGSSSTTAGAGSGPRAAEEGGLGRPPGQDSVGGLGRPPGQDSAAPISTRVTLLAGIAELASAVDVERAEAARAAAEARANELRSAGARSPGEGGAAAGAGPAVGDAAGEGAEERAADLELAEAEAALARAELRLTVVNG